MNVIHICSDFARQRVYDHLVTNLERNGMSKQFVYVPVRTKEEVAVKRNEALVNTKFCIHHVLRPYHRLLFRSNISTVYCDLRTSLDDPDYSLVHAHFLYSDGAVALRLYRERRIPYVVAVRNTDLNVFMRYRPDLRGTCFEILKHASAIIFLSPCYEDAFSSRLPRRVLEKVRSKFRVVPNGVPDAWLSQQVPRVEPDENRLRLLYVGDFSRNKNVPNTIRASGLLRDEFDVSVTLVGGGRDGAGEVDGMLGSGEFPWVDHVGRIDDQDVLAEICRNHDIFVMPSFLETFGVAYIEALSQGLPIVHSRGQGVDGFFQPDTVAEPVDPRSPEHIAAGVRLLATRMANVRNQCVEEARRFDWKTIAGDYLTIYESAA